MIVTATAEEEIYLVLFLSVRMKTETIIKLNKFKPKPYQRAACLAFEQGYKKLLLVFPRRCLSGESHILLADKTTKLLKDIQAGDAIIAWDGKRFVEDVVEEVWQTGVKEAIAVEHELHPTLIASPEHKFAHTINEEYKGFAPLREIPIDSAHLLTYMRKADAAFCVKPHIKPAPACLMYDLRTRTHHNFVANGYVVHNSGKDVVAFNLMIRAALQRVGIYYYILPTAVQARRVLFEGKTSDGQRMLSFIPEELVKAVNMQQMKITLVNDSQIIFVGSDNFHALRGSNFVGCVMSEAAFQHPDVYPTIRPILAANDGWVIMISTPFGENHFYKMYQIAKDHPEEWFCQLLTVDDTQHMSIEQIQAEIDSGEISPDMAQQEYWVSFSTGATGSYYAKYLNRMEMNDQIGSVLWEPSYPVITSWDLGMRDSTVILFAQLIGTSIHIFDMYENSDVGIEHYVHVLQSKEYKYKAHIGPHDLSVREWTGGGITRKQKAAQLGIEFITAPNISIIDGIESVRTTLPRIFIDKTRCAKLLSALRNYRKEYDTLRKVYLPKPTHDSNSHYCDSLRYLCLALPKLQRGMTEQDVEREYRSATGQSQLSGFFGDW